MWRSGPRSALPLRVYNHNHYKEVCSWYNNYLPFWFGKYNIMEDWIRDIYPLAGWISGPICWMDLPFLESIVDHLACVVEGMNDMASVILICSLWRQRLVQDIQGYIPCPLGIRIATSVGADNVNHSSYNHRNYYICKWQERGYYEKVESEIMVKRGFEKRRRTSSINRKFSIYILYLGY